MPEAGGHGNLRMGSTAVERTIHPQFAGKENVMPSADAGRKEYKLFVDGKQYDWAKQYITGSELRALAAIPAGVQVFLEEPGPEKPDRAVPPDASINLAEPGVEKFYTVPPATFGR